MNGRNKCRVGNKRILERARTKPSRNRFIAEFLLGENEKLIPGLENLQKEGNVVYLSLIYKMIIKFMMVLIMIISKLTYPVIQPDNMSNFQVS